MSVLTTGTKPHLSATILLLKVTYLDEVTVAFSPDLLDSPMMSVMLETDALFRPFNTVFTLFIYFPSPSSFSAPVFAGVVGSVIASITGVI